MSQKLNNGAWPAMDDELPVDNLQEQLVDIDIEELDGESSKAAQGMIENLNTLYGDEELLTRFPQTKTRLDIELETLRGLIKMRKSDEWVHDAILKAVASAPTNASLYRSLSEIQKTSLQVTTKMNETIENINKILKLFQQELDRSTGKISASEGGAEMIVEDGNSDTFRGSKAFIQAMSSDKAV